MNRQNFFLILMPILLIAGCQAALGQYGPKSFNPEKTDDPNISKITIPHSGQILLLDNRTGQLMVENQATGKSKNVHFEGSNIYLDPSSGRLSIDSGWGGKPSPWTMDNREMFLCGISGKLLEKDPMSDQMAPCIVDGNFMFISSETGEISPKR